MVTPQTFNFAKTPAIYFGTGVFNKLPTLVSRLGKTVLLVTGGASLQKSGRLDKLCSALTTEGIKSYVFQISGEPSPEIVDAAVSGHRAFCIDAVVGIGGGSAIDGAKAISAMLPLGEGVFNYLEGVGSAQLHNGSKLPFIAVPTTAGTGSEATKNAVLSRIGSHGFKKSLRHDNFVPDIALIDPELTLSCPQDVAAACAMDAFTQLMESYVSVKASPMTDSLAFGALRLAVENLEASCAPGAVDIAARSAMAYAATMSGITLANAGLGVVHGLASSVGAAAAIPHGVVCGTLVAAATSANIRALRASGSAAIQKYAEIGSLITGEKLTGKKELTTALNALLERLSCWSQTLNMPRLSNFGVKQEHMEAIAGVTSNKESPVRLSRDEIKSILAERL
ncbi:MAG: iron-containing alcohol dehydrogenase [Nitrospirae bacterium]|nr:iron-containing alcohol dehydrogenase [Nitrospirota bacterium]